MSDQTKILYPAIGGIIGGLVGFGFGIAFSVLTGRPFSPLWIAICATAGITLGLSVSEQRKTDFKERE